MTRDEMLDWARGKQAVLDRFPGPEQEATRHALQLVQAGQLQFFGHPTLATTPAVVPGGRGGLHEAQLRSGGEFDFAGQRWVTSAYNDPNRGGQRVMVGALRRDAADALFEAQIFVDPAAERLKAEQAKLQNNLRLLVTYGLSEEAYRLSSDVVAHIAARGAQGGGDAPGNREAEIGHRLLSSARLLELADTWSYGELLHPGNSVSRAAFTRLTGAALPPSIRDGQALLDGPPPPSFEPGRLTALPPCREAVLAVGCDALAQVERVLGNTQDLEQAFRNSYVHQGWVAMTDRLAAVSGAFLERTDEDGAISQMAAAAEAMQGALQQKDADGFQAGLATLRAACDPEPEAPAPRHP